MRYSIQHIAEITEAKLITGSDQSVITEICFDSRKIVNPFFTLFLCFNNKTSRSGNDFIQEAKNKGVNHFITDQLPDESTLNAVHGSNILLVKDTMQALHKLAIHHRGLFQISMLGITGSNGKTIIKEWLYQILHEQVNIVRSPRSYNSQLGVPLSVLQTDTHHELGIFEAGISQQGEMDNLQRIIRPDIGILTYMGDAHAEGFSSFSQKIREKLILFKNALTLIYCSDSKDVQTEVLTFQKEINPDLQLLSWGYGNDAMIRIDKKSSVQNQTILQYSHAAATYSLTIPFADEASVFNAMTCICYLIHLGWTSNQIQQRISGLHALEMRLELKQGNQNTLLINDSYSADLSSLKIALDFMVQHRLHQKATVILSDFLESGNAADLLYKQLAEMLTHYLPFKLIGIGPAISEHKRFFDVLPEKYFFDSTSSLLNDFSSFRFENETILIKGARMFRFERIVNRLEMKIHETVLEINLSSIRQNLKFYRSHLKPGVKVMAMVKAFSYGSGSHEIAHLLQDEGVDYLAVAYTDEGADLRKAGVRLPIMVMNPAVDDFEAMISHRLEPEIYSFHILDAFISYIQKNDINLYPIHIKLDTGMHRLGFEAHEIEKLGISLQENDQIRVRSVFSHLVASEDPVEDEFTLNQFQLFQKMTSDLERYLDYSFLKHICNSAGIIRHPDLQLDMVRLGIGLYVAAEGNQPVAILKTTIAQIKQVKKGDTVGYGRAGKIEKDSSIATVRIGYADGYPRNLSHGKGTMLVNGNLAPVIGSVCMDMTMIDITGIQAAVGDTVIVFGENPNIRELARQAQTISYEILTGISQRVKRVYFQE